MSNTLSDVDSKELFSSNFRLNQQILFLAELDKLKDVLRQSLVAGSRRQENSAEHSWHLVMRALVLMEHVKLPDLDRLRILKMLLVHDVVGIDAGDTFYYDVAGNATKSQRELAAAERIFSLLPSDQAGDLRRLWDEFEAEATPEARVAQAFDRLQAVLQNLHSGGAGWRRNGVAKAQVLERNQKIGAVMPEIWAMLTGQFELAAERGDLR
jgi:putative hydrolase of HD superfamily